MLISHYKLSNKYTQSITLERVGCDAITCDLFPLCRVHCLLWPINFMRAFPKRVRYIVIC